MRLKIMGTLLAVVMTAGWAYGWGNYNIYGIHFYGDNPAAENTIKNGKGMYSVEMYYTQGWMSMTTTQKNNEQSKLNAIKNKGFKIILRLDYNQQYTVPPLNNWTARYYYAVTCGEIADKMENIVDLYVIGNEMTTSPESSCRDALWYAKVYNGYDNNCAYYQIHDNDDSATVMVGGLTAWPYYIGQIDGNNIDWLATVQSNVNQDGDEAQIDGYALHAYSGTEYYNDSSSAVEDPRFSDVTGMRSFIQFLKVIYNEHGYYIPVHITETNTYWFNTGFADSSYRSAWTKEAFQTIDEWNACSDLKIDSLCWFTYSTLGITDPNSDIYGNALMRTNNTNLNTARSDFNWVTYNKNMIPGNPGSTLRFQAENYTNSAEWVSDVGVEGTDYHDTDNTNQGGYYRNGDVTQAHVDIGLLPDWSGFFIGWTANGEWLRYETIAGGRNYKVRVRYSRGSTGNGSVRFAVDGTNKATITLPYTGSWDTYTTADSSTFYMSAGYHTIKMHVDTAPFNVDYFEFIPQ